MTAKRMKITLQRRQDSTSSFYCCVPRCTSSAKFNSFLSFHTFPRDPELRRLWVTKIRRDNLNINNSTRVCSRHFRTTNVVNRGTELRQWLKPGAVPELFLWNNFSLSVPQPGVCEGREQLDDTSHALEQVKAPHTLDHDYCSKVEPAALDLAQNHTEELQADVARLKKQIEEMTINNRFGLERFSRSDDDIRFYTRFSTHTHLMMFWWQIEPAVHRMVRVTRANTAAQTEVPQSNESSLLPIDEFFLFTNYLALGLMQRDLAHRFKIHQSTVSRIINTWANFLYSVLGAVGIWMSEETVKAHLPDVFNDYSDTQVVLDCTELRCRIPNTPLLQSEVFPNYKSHCTFKGLIGMAPHGAITFVSPLYEGSISDKAILKQSGIVSLLKPTMAVMVDKGFHVKDCVPCKVNIPAFVSRRAKLTESEVRQTQSIVRLRIHIECLIRRVKQHKIFSTIIPPSLAGSINQLYCVTCLLVNYQNGPLV